MKALIIDDSRAMRMFLSNIVKELGFETVEAGDGLEALKQLETNMPIDVALVDIDMPNMNGIEFLTAARKNPVFDSVKMMMVTSHTSMNSVEDALRLGAQDYLMKPLTKEMLQEKFQILGY